jgi:hypothetical protein
VRSFLILPGLYTKDSSQLKLSQPVLSVFVVALLTAGYSFTALLCFACRNEAFQAENVFLYAPPSMLYHTAHANVHCRPALASSALGLISIAYNFLSSHAYYWGTSAITGTVISSAATLTYGALLLWTQYRASSPTDKTEPRQLWSNESYYSNFVQNMYPTAAHSPLVGTEAPISEDDRVNQQMALLLMKSDQLPSPDAHSATFRIDLPEDTEQIERHARSQELVGTPAHAHAGWNRDRADSRPDSLSEQWQERGRTPNRPTSADQRSTHSRGLSREERRREIELGHP